MEPDRRRGSHREVEVRCPALEHRLEQLRDRNLDLLLCHLHAHHFTTLAISSMDVTPAARLLEAVVAERLHALLDRPRSSRSPPRRALDGQPLDLFGHQHDLVQADPAPVPGVRAGPRTPRAGRTRRARGARPSGTRPRSARAPRARRPPCSARTACGRAAAPRRSRARTRRGTSRPPSRSGG